MKFEYVVGVLQLILLKIIFFFPAEEKGLSIRVKYRAILYFTILVRVYYTREGKFFYQDKNPPSTKFSVINNYEYIICPVFTPFYEELLNLDVFKKKFIVNTNTTGRKKGIFSQNHYYYR